MFKREMMTVYVRDDSDGMVEHVIEVTHQDQLRGETEAVAKRGLSMTIREAPITWNTLFAWCALTRLGLYKGEWRQFQNVDCLGYDEVQEEEVPPTNPEADTSGPSPSAATSPASTGSPPTTT